MDEIVREIRDMDRCEIFMGREDYVIFLKTRLRRFVVPLNSTELKLLDHLLDSPEAAYRDISEELEISPQWVSKKIKDLRLRRVLHRHDLVPFPKVGIQNYHVLLGCEDKSRNLVSYLTSSPFLCKAHNMMAGSWDLHAELCVPDNRMNTLALERFVVEMEERGIHAEVLEIDSMGASHCYDHYSPSEPGWNVPWEVMRVQLRRIYNDELADVIPKINERTSKTNLYLDELDMRIFNLAQKGITSISRVRDRLRMAQDTVATRLKRLKEGGLIETRYSAQNIGLVEKVLMISDDKRAADSISAWAQRLPQASIAFTREGVLCCQAWLPVGGGYGAMWSVEILPVRITAGLLSLPAVFNYWIPHRLWDVDNQSWRHSSEALEEWFQSLDEADREVRPQATWA
ncbi:ArsR family transcriptional regulator [Candidatus Thorarchaeota archaeon]|nr:MAG: ArsR family transcriptional regulator [Candidatus Thorarchaeota archaeon]